MIGIIMKKVTIEPGCISCGLCEFVAPAVFEITDVSHVKKDAPVAQYAAEIKQAAAGCPVQVITYQE